MYFQQFTCSSNSSHHVRHMDTFSGLKALVPVEERKYNGGGGGRRGGWSPTPPHLLSIHTVIQFMVIKGANKPNIPCTMCTCTCAVRMLRSQTPAKKLPTTDNNRAKKTTRACTHGDHRKCSSQSRP